MTIRQAWCALTRHREFRTVQRFGAARKVQCTGCHRYFAVHDGMGVVTPWDDDAEELYGFITGQRTLR
jgi:hypothetical protein